MGKGRMRLWRGLGTLTAALTAVAIAGTGIANANAAFINSRLGTVSSVVTGGSADADTEYYKSEFTSLEELVEALDETAVALSQEGTVLLKNNGVLPVDAASGTVTLWGMNSHYPTLGGLLGSSPAAGTGQTSY